MNIEELKRIRYLMIDLKNLKITPEMLGIISQLDEFKGAWNVLRDRMPEQLTSLKKVATIESIGSSNRIEGNRLSDKEVETILLNIKRQSFITRDEQEVAGYAELMDEIFTNYEVIPFTENYIKQLHKILLSHCDKDECHRGEYKKISNAVAAFASDGKEIGIVFETATPFETPEMMRSLINQTREMLEDKALHPVILIALFIVHFLAIHPFQDGNGRLSRILITLFLLKTGYSYVPYSSMETIIEENKDSYYNHLRKTQKTLKSVPDYEPWLLFFLKSMQKQKLRLENKINLQTVEKSLPLLATKIIELFNEANRWTSPELAQRLQANRDTVSKNLTELVNRGILIKNGSTRGAWYEKK